MCWPFAEVWLEDPPPPRRKRRYRKTTVERKVWVPRNAQTVSSALSFPLLTASATSLHSNTLRMHHSTHIAISKQLRQQLPLPPQPTHKHRRHNSASAIMSANGNEYEHWPSDNQRYTQPAPPAPGFDGNNGVHSHSYLIPPKQKSASPAPGGRSDSKSPQPPPVVSYPQPIYYGYPPQGMTHPSQQQYYSHPVPMAMQPPPAAYPGFWAAPPMAPAPAPAPVAITGNEHYYIPIQQAPKPSEPAPTGNAWIGRTKAEVEEDNMKLAKSENVYAPRKLVPQMDDDQMVWVIELDKTRTLRYVVAVD